jgi:hypothetical protein
MYMKSKAYAICLLSLGLLLAGCKQTASPSPTPQADTAVTVVALQTENSQLKTQVAEATLAAQTLPPTSTPILPTATEIPPTATPTTWATVVIPTNTITLTQPAAPGFVFLVDPNLWTEDRTTGDPKQFLAHKDYEDCRVDIASILGNPTPLRYYPRQLGARYWLVSEYAQNAIYQIPDLALNLTGFLDENCFADQETVLEDVITLSAYRGGPPSTPVPTPTRRPPMTDFDCQGALPPRLSIGDNALVTAGFLWLRTDPRVAQSTEIRIFQQYAPVTIKVTAGPQCVKPYVYWQVEVTDTFGTPQIYTGWMAESDGNEYLLDVWYLGW